MTVAIDPDCDCSGIATLSGGTLSLLSLNFWPLRDWLCENAHHINAVHIEAGWLNTKANFHTEGYGERVAATVGSKVGANAQVGRLLYELCQAKGISVVLRKPLKKCWGKTRKGKISHAEFIALPDVQPKPKRTNQETRDAGLLVLSGAEGTKKG